MLVLLFFNVEIFLYIGNLLLLTLNLFLFCPSESNFELEFPNLFSKLIFKLNKLLSLYFEELSFFCLSLNIFNLFPLYLLISSLFITFSLDNFDIVILLLLSGFINFENLIFLLPSRLLFFFFFLFLLLFKSIISEFQGNCLSNLFTE